MVAAHGGGERRPAVVTGAGGGPRLRVVHYLLLVALIDCGGGVSPFRRRAVVGRDTYAVFAADAPGGAADLYAVRGDGGEVFQITFTPVREARPALSPDGAALAFLRGQGRADTLPGTPWVMNLLTGSERRLELPGEARAEAIGWSRDGRTIYVSAGQFAYAIPAPPDHGPARAVPPDQWQLVDSALGVFAGEPPFARVFACEQTICAAADTGGPRAIADEGRDPARWGPDSVAYFAGDELLVRPVGPGRARRVPWSHPPSAARQLTVFGGAPAPPPP